MQSSIAVLWGKNNIIVFRTEIIFLIFDNFLLGHMSVILGIHQVIQRWAPYNVSCFTKFSSILLHLNFTALWNSSFQLFPYFKHTQRKMCAYKRCFCVQAHIVINQNNSKKKTRKEGQIMP